MTNLKTHSIYLSFSPSIYSYGNDKSQKKFKLLKYNRKVGRKTWEKKKDAADFMRENIFGRQILTKLKFEKKKTHVRIKFIHSFIH